MRRKGLATIYALFLASGATALVYQVAWTRNLSLIFGASFEAISIVLAAFMAGLAAGGFSFGRRAARLGRPLRLYGILEIGVAVFALALPPLLRLTNAAYLAIALRADGVDWSVNAARVAMAFAVLLLPTFFMGGTLPVLVRVLVHRHGELGERLAGLYAINTLGAVIGTLTAGFVLLPTLGVWRSELLAALANGLIGVVAIAADRALRARERESPELVPAGTQESTPQRGGPPSVAGSPGPAAAPASGAARWPFRLAFWGTGVAGMAALALEVAWSRAIAIASGANTYSFTVMLATFLAGIAIGSRLHAIHPARRVNESVQLGVVFALLGISCALVSEMLPNLPKLALLLNAKLLGGGAGIRADTTFVLSFLVMLVPCILMGVAFPLAGEARARLDLRFGEAVGDLVGLNTLGAIFGSLLAGFVLIPQLGLQRTALLASAAYLGYGLLVLSAAWGTARPQLRGVAWAGAAASLPLAFGLALGLPRWDARPLAALPNNDQSLFMNEQGEIDFGLALERTELLYAREGRGSTVSVIRNGGIRSLLINGKVVATDGLGDMQHEYLLGHLPTLLHPEPRSAAVIGLGAGLTLGGVAAEESIESIVVVEIEPAVQGAAQLFADIQDDAVSDPRVELVWQDGRNYLQTTKRRFDVITADPIHPWAQGAAYLYTTEYYAMIARHLRPGGIACQWLPLYELSRDDLKSVVASFIENFEHATLWQATGDLLLIGSNAPIAVDLDTLQERLQRPRASRQLARVGLEEPLSFLAEFAMDRAAMERFARGAITNTDDNLYLEFSSPLSIGINPRRHLPLFDSYRGNASAVVRERGSRFGSREEMEAAFEGLQTAKSRTIQAAPRWQEVTAAPTKAGLEELTSHYREALALGPEYRHAAVLLAACYAMLGELHREDGDSEAALQWYRRALEADPGNTTANLHVGVEMARRHQLERALAHFERAAWRTPASADAQAAAGQALMALHRSAEALLRFDVALRLRPDLAEPHRLRCQCLRELGELEEAIEACRAALALAPADPRAALELAETLHRAGRHRIAVDALREGLAASPSHRALRVRLAWRLATSPDPEARNGPEALRLIAPEARRTRDPNILRVFAAALAEAGRFQQAATAATRGARLAAAKGQPQLAQQLRRHLESYQAGRPVREGG